MGIIMEMGKINNNIFYIIFQKKILFCFFLIILIIINKILINKIHKINIKKKENKNKKSTIKLIIKTIINFFKLKKILNKWERDYQNQLEKKKK
jgi:hypothetical protein